MFVLSSYAWAVVFCVVTMLCWGSWANTQKLAGRAWRFELFYWDYVLGVFLLSVLMAFTLGSIGSAGRGFLEDVAQADSGNMLSAFVGGVVFNIANILLVAAIAIAGMSVAFPVGIGLALVLGVVVNYLAAPVGNPVVLFLGVGLVAAAIVLDAAAYRKLPSQGRGLTTKGLVLSILCGVLMGFFYRFVADSMSTDFVNLEPGKLGPYSAVFFFSLGLLASNFVLNPIIMKKPFVGEPVAMSEYFKGSLGLHSIGVLGGLIWGVGMTFSIIASGQASFAISYGLGQGATMVAALWGVFIWKEFKEAPGSTGRLLTLMFLGYLAGLAMIIAARFN
ncbi:MAG: multidrug DMT transporter permease [Acidobacteria bacterium]|nr:MAG: multidrug DMT transporter permease [Acidobacteriota bacterium]